MKTYKVAIVRYFQQNEVIEVEAKSEEEAAGIAEQHSAHNDFTADLVVSDTEDIYIIDSEGNWNDPKYNEYDE